MDLTLLKTLRTKIVTAKDFSEVFDYFFDNFGENPEFMDVSEPVIDDLLIKVLESIGRSLFKTENVRFENLLLLRVPEYNFIHGGMVINGAPATVLYCDDSKVGIFLAHTKLDPPTRMARFSAEQITPALKQGLSNFKH